MFLKYFKLSSFLSGIFFLPGCMGNPNGPPPINYPFFEVTEPMEVKKIVVPVGTKIFYEKHFFKEGKQEKIMSEKKLRTIEFPIDKAINWGGVPVISIIKYFNTEMRGYSVYADFNQLDEHKKTRFSELWKSCNDNLGIDVKNADDWSFNTSNISDVQNCGVLYQRYFKEDTTQQNLLDDIYAELMKIDSN